MAMILSLTDLARMAKQARNVLFLSAAVCSCATFFYLLGKPIHFTSCGIFNGNVAQRTIFSKALQFLGEEDRYLSSDDQRSFLRSYPVLEEVVKNLHLQATLTESRSAQRVREIWYALKTGYVYSPMHKNRLPSEILNSNVYVTDKLIVPDKTPAITCRFVDFSSETTLSLKIYFFDETHYRVFACNKEIGQGMLGAPFYCDMCSFKLDGCGKKGKVLGLHLLPLKQAVDSLKANLQILKNKENTSLIDIRYTHRDRHLAAQIVNEVMDQFQLYLQKEGKKKITKQLDYLHQRQEETMEHLDEILQKHRMYLESNLDTSAIVTLEKELEFMAEKQNTNKQELLHIRTELEALSRVLHNPPLSFEDIFNAIRTSREQQTLQALTVEAARNLIQHHQQQLDLICLDSARYAYCQEKLLEPDFDCSSLASMLDDATLLPHFDKMRSLHHGLVDEKNWAEKEREQLKGQLETEKMFLLQYIRHLHEGASLHAKVLEERIFSLQQNLLYLLYDRYEQTQHSLECLVQQSALLPQKWLTEQKIELNTKLYREMMESITKMIEAKNIGYHLDYLMANVLQQARPAILPDNPHLLAGILLGGLGGICITLIGMCFYLVWMGPAATFENLTSLKRRTINPGKPIQQIAAALTGPVILLTGKKKSLLADAMTNWFKRREEKVCVIDLSTPFIPISLKMYAPTKDALFAQSRLQNLLDDLKRQYDRILILSKNAPDSFETQTLLAHADLIVYSITEERLAEIEPLPEMTFFFISTSMSPMLPLDAINPLLNRLLKRLKSSSFSFLTQSFLQLSPQSKTSKQM